MRLIQDKPIHDNSNNLRTQILVTITTVKRTTDRRKQQRTMPVDSSISQLHDDAGMDNLPLKDD